jgi:hypothetical protein
LEPIVWRAVLVALVFSVATVFVAIVFFVDFRGEKPKSASAVLAFAVSPN